MNNELELKLQKALTLLRKLKRGSCWCEAGIGNPMVKCGETCRKIKELLNEK